MAIFLFPAHMPNMPVQMHSFSKRALPNRTNWCLNNIYYGQLHTLRNAAHVQCSKLSHSAHPNVLGKTEMLTKFRPGLKRKCGEQKKKHNKPQTGIPLRAAQQAPNRHLQLLSRHDPKPHSGTTAHRHSSLWQNSVKFANSGGTSRPPCRVLTPVGLPPPSSTVHPDWLGSRLQTGTPPAAWCQQPKAASLLRPSANCLGKKLGYVG